MKLIIDRLSAPVKLFNAFAIGFVDGPLRVRVQVLIARRLWLDCLSDEQACALEIPLLVRLLYWVQLLH